MYYNSDLRLLIYCNEALSLGHIRRNLTICAEIDKLYPSAAVLIIVDAPLAPYFELQEKCDFVTIPALSSIATREWRPDLRQRRREEVLRNRADTIKHVALDFKPHIFLVDHVPHGVLGELSNPIRALKEKYPKTKIVLGLKDILGSPEEVRAEWLEEDNYAMIEECYDQINIYGSSEIFNAVELYDFPEKLRSKVVYCGYICGDEDAGEPTHDPSLIASGAERGQNVLVTVGDGPDSVYFIELLLDVIRFLGPKIRMNTAISVGPFMHERQFLLLKKKAEGLPVTLAREGLASRQDLSTADLVIAMADYDTIGVLLSMKKKAIIVPRTGTDAEEMIRARKMAELGLLTTAFPRQLSIKDFANLILTKLAGHGGMNTANLPRLDGAAEAAALMLAEITTNGEGSAGIFDQNFPQLSKALDTAAMAIAFEKYFSRIYPRWGLKVRQCRIPRIEHKPGKACTILYHLAGSDNQNVPFDQWFLAKMSPGPARQLELGHEGTNAPLETWKPESRWPEMNLLLTAFPYDRSMPYLAKLMHKEYVSQQIAENLSEFGLSQDWCCNRIEIEKVRYVPGERCVLRYACQMKDSAGNERNVDFYSKTYKGSETGYLFQRLHEICQSRINRRNMFIIPYQIAHLKDVRTIWQSTLRGQRMRELGGTVGWESLLNSEMVGRIAAGLAEFHDMGLEPELLPQGLSMADTLANAQQHVDAIRDYLPKQEAALIGISGQLASLRETVASPTPPSKTIHGSFTLDRLSYIKDQVGIVHLDSIVSGDPLYDVAEFLASILFLQISHDLSGSLVDQAQREFIARYSESASWEFNHSRVAFYVAGFLLEHLHTALQEIELNAIKNKDLAFELIARQLHIDGNAR